MALKLLGHRAVWGLGGQIPSHLCFGPSAGKVGCRNRDTVMLFPGDPGPSQHAGGWTCGFRWGLPFGLPCPRNEAVDMRPDSLEEGCLPVEKEEFSLVVFLFLI